MSRHWWRTFARGQAKKTQLVLCATLAALQKDVEAASKGGMYECSRQSSVFVIIFGVCALDRRDRRSLYKGGGGSEGDVC